MGFVIFCLLVIRIGCGCLRWGYENWNGCLSMLLKSMKDWILMEMFCDYWIWMLFVVSSMYFVRMMLNWW